MKVLITGTVGFIVLDNFSSLIKKHKLLKKRF